MTDTKPDLSTAYALRTPDDSRKLYANWANSYDSDFADGQDYQLHRHVAQAFAKAGGQGPVLDVGAGTGLCGAALAKLNIGPIDAIDISAEMLETASAKRVYRDAFVADLTQTLSMPDESFRGIVSSGTFTTGHVGPDAIDELLRVAEQDALFALSVNAKHYDSAGFSRKIQTLKPDTYDLCLKDVPIYGGASSGAHKSDRAFVILFRKR